MKYFGISKLFNAHSFLTSSFLSSTGYFSLPQLNSIYLSHTLSITHTHTHTHTISLTLPPTTQLYLPPTTQFSLTLLLSLSLTPTGVEDVSMMTGEEVNAYDAFLVFLNGLIVGVHTKPTQLVEKGRSKV